MPNLTLIAPGHLIDRDRIFHAELSDGPEHELVLWIAGAVFDSGEEGGAGPWAITLTGQNALIAWRTLTGQGQAAPAALVMIEADVSDSDGLLGHTFKYGGVELFLSNDPTDPDEVFGPWTGSVNSDALLSAARAVDAITRDPRFRRPASIAVAAD